MMRRVIARYVVEVSCDADLDAEDGVELLRAIGDLAPLTCLGREMRGIIAEAPISGKMRDLAELAVTVEAQQP